MRNRGQKKKKQGLSGEKTPKWSIRNFAFVNVSDSSGFNFWCSVAVLLVAFCSCAEALAPTAYGRFGSDSASFSVDPRLGWWLMELPCTASFVYNFFFCKGSQKKEVVPKILAGIFLCHYLYRGWIFPALIRVHGKSSNFSLIPALGGWVVTVLHGYLNARWYADHGKHLTLSWLSTWRFRFGLFTYYFGLGLIIWHDHILRELRKDQNGPRYSIPRGGLFDYSTCAQYLAELICWFGFAVMSWGPNGVFIFCVSFVNLVPRSQTTHAWYISKFGDEYEQLNRTNLVPYVW